MAANNPLDVPALDWATINGKSISPSEALEEFATWLAQDAAVFCVEAELGNIPMPEAMEAVRKSAGMAEAVGIRSEFDALLRGRLNEMRTELFDFARQNGSGG